MKLQKVNGLWVCTVRINFEAQEFVGSSMLSAMMLAVTTVRNAGGAA